MTNEQYERRKGAFRGLSVTINSAGEHNTSVWHAVSPAPGVRHGTQQGPQYERKKRTALELRAAENFDTSSSSTIL